MCLSNAYTVKDGTETLVAQKVASVRQADGHVELTDLMGRTQVVTGRITAMDLIQNTIHIAQN